MSKMPKKFKDIVGKVYNSTTEFEADLLPKVKIARLTLEGITEQISFAVASMNPDGTVHTHYPLMAALDKEGFVVPSDVNNATIAVLGKGVIFDTGGYDLKQQMLDMHGDKAGAMAVLSVAEKLKRNNKVEFRAGFISNKFSVVPGTIVQTRNGVNVEIQNTDAEGRLVLADLIEDVQRAYPKLKHIITIATLTGSKAYALGKHYGALFTENKELKLKVFKNEDKLKLHPLPIPNDKLCRPYVSKRHGVDIPNVDGSRDLGHVKAYKFLKYFVKKGIQLHHIDMAGCELDSDRNPTGYGVEQLEFLIRNLCVVRK